MAKILVVDDEPNIRKVVGLVLESEGFDVDYASDGEEALSKLDDFTPDLVILDMFMPHLSGKGACERIRQQKNYDKIKVIFLTVALLSPKGKEELEELKISDYITKPFDNDDLIRRVKKALK